MNDFPDTRVLDLFAGAGGFSWGAHRVVDEVLGLEIDADAVATQHACGMTCEQVDISTALPTDYDPRREVGERLHLHASPPCQTFSAAGKGAGRKHLDSLCEAALDILREGYTRVDLSGVPEGSLLVLEPARWIHELRPDTVSLEQVRSVLPVWGAYVEGLDVLGYHAWATLLHSEQYGVPQTRTRAWLGASLHREVAPPTPTHSRYHVRKPERLDEGVLPWVSMAEALGWGHTAKPVLTVTAGGTGSGGGAEPFGQRVRKQMDDAAAEGEHWVGFPRRADNDDVLEIDGVEYRARDFRNGDQPAFGLTEKARSWTHVMQGGVSGEGKPRPVSEPAPPMSAKGTASVTDDPELHYGRGKRARRVTIEEAGILQGFPADFRWQGSKTSMFRQCGNAVNPQVAEVVLRGVL